MGVVWLSDSNIRNNAIQKSPFDSVHERKGITLNIALDSLVKRKNIRSSVIKRLSKRMAKAIPRRFKSKPTNFFTEVTIYRRIRY